MQHSVLLRHPDWISVGQSRARGQAFRGDTFLAACDLAQMFDALPDTDAKVRPGGGVKASEREDAAAAGDPNHARDA